MTSKQIFDKVQKEHGLDFGYTQFLKSSPKDMLRVTTHYPELKQVLSAYNLEKLTRKDKPYVQ